MVNYNGLYNKDYFGEKLTENHFYEKNLHFRIIENGTILPFKDLPDVGFFGGLVDEENNFVEGTAIHRGFGGGAYTPKDSVEYIPSSAIYLGMLISIWGHCLTDNIKRLWFLKSDVYRRYFKNCPILYTPMWGGIIYNFAKLLEILEIDPNKLQPVTAPVKYKNVILPDESFFLAESSVTYGKDKVFLEGSTDNFNGNDGAFFTKEYVDVIDRIRNYVLKNCSSIPQKKWYFFYGRKQVGEERIAKYFESKGYTILRPETLPIEVQLNILANCESFASLIGSVSHNIIFLRDKSNVTLVPRRAAFFNIYQSALNQVHDLDIFYIDSAFSLFAENFLGPFYLIVSENLRKHFGDEVTEKYIEEDFITFLSYFRYAKSRGLSENSNELTYLKDILPEFFKQLKSRTDLLEKFGVTLK